MPSAIPRAIRAPRSQCHCMHEFVYYFPDEAVLTDHCYWLGPWY